MKRTSAITFALGFASLVTGLSADPPDLMPRVEDHTSMWWKEGFPGVVEGVPWHRCIQTGRYAFVLDTETLTIPYLGPVQPGIRYSERNLPDQPRAGDLAAAELALSITVDGKAYLYSGGGHWSQHGGPRLIESGRFFQRADVTDLDFTADDGTQLNVDARFETAAWADQLALVLAAQPGLLPIPAGEASFGRVRGGFGLDGTNYLEIPLGPELDPEKFTLEFWAFVPADYQATKISPWLICKNHNELADGNFGILIRNGGVPQVRMNIGGGRDNSHVLDLSQREALKTESWNHLAISYDGAKLRFFSNGKLAGEKRIGRQRVPVSGALAFGRRQDNFGDGYRFRGVVDEIRLYDRALTLEELRLRYVKPELDRPALKPVAEWTFREEGRVSMTRLSEQWKDASMSIRLSRGGKQIQHRWELPAGETWTNPHWQNVSLTFDPVVFQAVKPNTAISVQASEYFAGAARPVEYDDVLGCHRVNLDGISPIVPEGIEGPSNDSVERVKLILSNPTDQEQTARLMFEKTAGGFRQRIGTPITGISAILRDRDGIPTGIPVQLSKNWHNDPESGAYSGQWFHGISQVRLPAVTTIELELTIAYGHWGGVPAASHAQLSLIGWGSNQLWDQSALGSWGESICFEPDQVQRDCTIMDVRPLMVRRSENDAPWRWTSNVGGGDVFRLFDPSGKRIPHSAMRAVYHRQGPCLTEVTYSGHLGPDIDQSTTVSLARSDDVVRGIYRIRLDVNQPMDFSRFVIFQIGADNYSSTAERLMAFGNESGLIREWETQRGGDSYRSEPLEGTRRIPWISLHDAIPLAGQEPAASANRGIVIRSWKARLGGKTASPWIAERGLNVGRNVSSTLDILPPPGISRLEPGDFIEAMVEHIVVPQFAREYYGPNTELRHALTQHENTWHLIHREAVANDRIAKTETGTLERPHPDVRIATENDTAKLTLSGGLGYIPLTFTGLSSPQGYQLWIDGKPLDQNIHGNDFWQADYDATTRTWSRTYNIPARSGDQTSEIQFFKTEPGRSPAR